METASRFMTHLMLPGGCLGQPCPNPFLFTGEKCLKFDTSSFKTKIRTITSAPRRSHTRTCVQCSGIPIYINTFIYLFIYFFIYLLFPFAFYSLVILFSWRHRFAVHLPSNPDTMWLPADLMSRIFGRTFTLRWVSFPSMSNFLQGKPL